MKPGVAARELLTDLAVQVWREAIRQHVIGLRTYSDPGEIEAELATAREQRDELEPPSGA